MSTFRRIAARSRQASSHSMADTVDAFHNPQESLDALAGDFHSHRSRNIREQRLHILKRVLDACTRDELAFVQRYASSSPVLMVDLFNSILPDEVCQRVLSYLAAGDLKCVAGVCRRWNSLLGSNYVWRELCTAHSFDVLAPFANSARAAGDRPGKDVVRKRRKTGDGGSAADSLPPVLSWHGVFKHNYLTHMNWRNGRYRVSTVQRRFDSRTLSLSFDGDTAVSAASGSGSGDVWDMRTGELQFRIAGHEGGISAARFNRAYVVSGGTDRTVRVWDQASGACVRVLRGHADEVTAVHHDNEHVVSGSEDMTLRMWRIADGEEVRVFVGHTGAVSCLQFDKDKLVSGSIDGSVKVWSLRDGECVRTLRGHSGEVYCLQYLGKQLVTGSGDRTLRVWDWRSGRCDRVLAGHTAVISCVQFDEHKIVSGSVDKSIRVWETRTGRCLYTIFQTASLWTLSFDRTRLITSSLDQSLRVWDFSSSSDEHREVEMQ